MPEGRVILVTGAAGAWGGRVAGALAATPGLRVLGIDARPAEAATPGLDFVQADVRNPLLPELLRDEGVASVVHLAFAESDRPDEHAYEANVTGVTRLLAACAAAGVRYAVVASSTLAYGARPDNSAFLHEDHPLHGSETWGIGRDLAAREAACGQFAVEAPGMRLAVLRFAHLVGPAARSPLARFLAEPWAPALLGFDPMMQVLDEEDAAAALVHAVVHEAVGTYNIAAESPLPLSQVMTLAGKLPLPLLHQAVYWGRGLGQVLAGSAAERCLPIDADYLRYPCVGDLARMRAGLGFAPRHSAVEALRRFAAGRQAERFGMVGPAEDEARLRETIERRRRAREEPDGEL